MKAIAIIITAALTGCVGGGGNEPTTWEHLYECRVDNIACDRNGCAEWSDDVTLCTGSPTRDLCGGEPGCTVRCERVGECE